MNLVFFVLKATGSGQKMAKTKVVWKRPIDVVRRVRVNRQVNNLRGVLEEGFLLIF